MTVAEFADLYLADGPAEKPNKKAASWGADRSNIERHIKPLLGKKMVKALTQADIAHFQTDVAAARARQISRRRNTAGPSSKADAALRLARSRYSARCWNSAWDVS